jgi:hypothetical protein
MPRWEKEGDQVHVSHLFAPWMPSRAVNPSAGDDPISLGMFSGQSASVPIIIGPPPPPAEAPSPPIPVPPPQDVPAPAAPPPAAEPMRNMLLLDDGRVHLNGRYLSLNVDQLAEVMRLVMDAYEQKLRDEVTTLRLEFNLLPPPTEGPAMQAPSNNGRLVPTMPAEEHILQSAPPRHETPADMQPLPSGEAAQRGVPMVQGRKARARTAASGARHAVPRADAGPPA